LIGRVNVLDFCLFDIDIGCFGSHRFEVVDTGAGNWLILLDHVEIE